MKKLILLFQSLAIGLLLHGICFATTVDVDSIQSIVLGKEMTSMKVLVNFSGNGGTFESNWLADIGGGFSGVTGDWGSLTFSADNGTMPDETDARRWSLTANSGYSIDSLTLYGGDVVFDVYYGLDLSLPIPKGAELTDGSQLGFWDGWSDPLFLTPVPSSDPLTGAYAPHSNWDWTFSDVVALNGLAPEYDLYNVFSMDFSRDPFTSGQAGGTRVEKWQLDTDLAVPEPTTMILFGFGLLGLTAMGRKRT